MKQNNLDIRMAGLGGQGVVTAAHILGTAVVNCGKFAVVNPFFGAEKRLAPTESYVRISEEPIYDRGEILYPNFIMIFAPQVITMGKSYTMPFYSGLQDEGLVIINSDEDILSDKEKEGLLKIGAKVVYIPATRLAVEFAGTELATNMTMLGALCGMIELVNLTSVVNAVEERFSGKSKFVASGTTAVLDEVLKSKYKKMTALVEKNTAAINKAFEYAAECKTIS
ncbi:Pyruvate:ferredoxin oxidoreductase, gamma subunit [Chitinispirillum alkaliphilum]|nr:Pyruvate:ferredoxin oxidoreductase, gamma subunit [Chitinispirillum alkaliphilum]